MHASAVALITGHEKPSTESTLDWPALARFPGTLVFYMGMSRLMSITQALLDHGKPAQTPAAIVHRATTGEQRTVESTLGEVVSATQQAGVTAPAIIIVGSVVSLRHGLSWFELRPLFGKRVLVTRPRHQAGDLVHRLEWLGAVPVVLPAVEIREPADWGPVDRALENLSSYDWIVFTSANGVRAFIRRLRQSGRDLRALGPVKLAAIGPKTAAALQEYQLMPDLVPARFQSEDLAAELRSRLGEGQRVLLARADRGRDVLRQELTTIAQVEQVAVYSQIDAVEPDDEVLDSLRRGEIDYITLTSSNIARSLIQRLDATCRARVETGDTKIVCISPITSADVRDMGLPVAAEATEATVEGLVKALVQLAGREKQCE
jgi:uroporphyrinogen III methyltransferase/synthase